MAEKSVRVDRIDHVTLFVADRDEAVQWYERVLGLEISEEFRQWAEAGGPLLLETDAGETKLAVFEGRTDRSSIGGVEPHLAFRFDADSFVAFVDRLEGRSEDTNWPTGSRAAIVDHDLSFSIYFRDPSGNRLEVTTDEYEAVADELLRHPDG